MGNFCGYAGGTTITFDTGYWGSSTTVVGDTVTTTGTWIPTGPVTYTIPSSLIACW